MYKHDPTVNFNLEDKKLRKKIKKSLTQDANKYYDICESLRCTYDALYKEKYALVVERLIDAMILAKKMANRLTYYKEVYKDKTGKSGGTIKVIPASEALKKKQERRNR
jgi:hypothetical protein